MAVAKRAPAEPVARLRLDMAEPMAAPAEPSADEVIEEAIAAVQMAASAARASAAAASASAQRIAALEQSVATLRAEASASRDEAASWRARADDHSAAGRWMKPLLLAVTALAIMAAWLAWRLRALREETQRAWRKVADSGTSAQATGPIPLVTAELNPPVAVEPAVAAAPSELPVELSGEVMHERTDLLPPGSRHDDGAPRDVSIEELLDLEQQAEFFVALGQDDAAIDLLMDHLRSTGGGSPLPYLKLLEIYRRRDDREAYERTRSRFNDRFNAYAPDWDSDLQAGRSLEE